MGPVPGTLHTEARKLAEPGGNRNQPVLPAVPGTAKNPITGRSAAGSQGLGSENESESGHPRLALYPQQGTLEVRLQKKPDYAVRDLVVFPRSLYCRTDTFRSSRLGYVKRCGNHLKRLLLVADFIEQ